LNNDPEEDNKENDAKPPSKGINMDTEDDKKD
jgi:hypothetical protein